MEVILTRARLNDDCRFDLVTTHKRAPQLSPETATNSPYTYVLNANATCMRARASMNDMCVLMCSRTSQTDNILYAMEHATARNSSTRVIPYGRFCWYGVTVNGRECNVCP